MKRDLFKWAAWRDLDVMQMVFWPNTPRRTLVGLLTFLMFTLLALYVLYPRYVQLEQEKDTLSELKANIVKTYQISPQLLTNIPAVRQVRREEESLWLADLATVARRHQLQSVRINTHELTDQDRGKLREHIQVSVKNSSRLINNQGLDLPLDWLTQVGWVDIKAQGSYTTLLQFVSEIGTRGEWLAIGAVDLRAVNDHQVGLELGLWYYKQPNSRTPATRAAPTMDENAVDTAVPVTPTQELP